MNVRRTLAPVGYRVPIQTLVSSAALALVRRNARADLMRAIERHFGALRALDVCSGKAALLLILKALSHGTSRRKVIIPAYTCYSVPSAIVKAGLEVVPCDLAEHGLDYDYEQLAGRLGPDVLCVLSVHLFGIPSNTRRLMDACRGTGIFVVEDAAQAMGGVVDGTPLGTIGDVGFFSLGRGKNITCGSGGIVLTRNPEIAKALERVAAGLPGPGAASAVSFLALLALSVLVSPLLYWFPSGLPLLRLGETIFHEEFPVRRLSRFQALLLRDWRRHLSALDAIRRRNSAHYVASVDGAWRDCIDVACLRFPVVLSDPGRKRRLLDEQDGAALGISPMYPTSVARIAQLQGRLREYDFPRAERVASSLVTLPTHPLVTARDRERVCAAVNAVQDHSRGVHGTTGQHVVHMSGRP